MLICWNKTWKQGWWVIFVTFWLPRLGIPSQVHGRVHFMSLSEVRAPSSALTIKVENARHSVCQILLTCDMGPANQMHCLDSESVPHSNHRSQQRTFSGESSQSCNSLVQIPSGQQQGPSHGCGTSCPRSESKATISGELVCCHFSFAPAWSPASFVLIHAPSLALQSS